MSVSTSAASLNYSSYHFTLNSPIQQSVDSVTKQELIYSEKPCEVNNRTTMVRPAKKHNTVEYKRSSTLLPIVTGEISCKIKSQNKTPKPLQLTDLVFLSYNENPDT